MVTTFNIKGEHMSQSTFVFAKITPKPEYFTQSRNAIEEIIPATKSEPGCLKFTLHEDGAGSLYLYEEWSDDDALDRHHAMDYTKAVFEAYKSWLVSSPEIIKLAKLA